MNLHHFLDKNALALTSSLNVFMYDVLQGLLFGSINCYVIPVLFILKTSKEIMKWQSLLKHK
jgi:hypothetical protein